MKYLKYLTVLFLAFIVSSCNDEPPVLPGLAKSDLVLATFPGDASITINSRKESVSPVIYSELEPGFYKVDIKKSQYLDTTLYFIIKRNTRDSLLVELRETPSVWWKTYNTSNSLIQSNSISDIEVDLNNNIWIASKLEGLSCFKDSQFIKYGIGSGLTTKVINKILADKVGNIWLGTKDGLFKFDGVSFRAFTVANSNLPDNNVTSLAVDNNNAIWAGTKNGGLVKFDGVSFVVYNTNNSGIPLNDIPALYIDKDNAVWIGTWGEGLAKFTNNKWTYFSKALTNIPCEFVSSIDTDFDGNIIIGTGTASSFGGFSILKNGSFITYSLFNSKIPSGIITDVKKGFNNKIWICTSEGLASYSKGVIKVFNITNSGLPGYVVVSIAVDKNDTKWVGSTGLSKYIGSKI